VLSGIAVLAAALSVITGCSHRAVVGGKPTSSPARSSSAPASLPPGAVGVSPTGVTTRVDVPAESTEEEYFQACHAAKTWMEAQPSTEQSLLEPYLAMVQAAKTGPAGSWNTRWRDLTPARQAAVIVAAEAAANNQCG
jgi:hypothetical protein